MDDAKFATWAIVEVMGHGRFAGYASSDSIAGPMLRVDVPETEHQPAFTKYFAPSSLFAVTPCTEQTARAAAAAFRERPVAMFELPMLRAPQHDDEDDDWPDHDMEA